MNRYTSLAASFFIFISLLSPAPARADTILDDFQVNTEFPGHPPQDSPYSVANWQTQRIYTTFLSKHDGTNWDVALARHNYNLEPVGQTTYLNVREGTYNCLRPKLVIRSTGVGAAWIEARSPNRIMFRSLDGNGNPTCPPVRVEDDFSNVPRDSLSIAALYDGFLLVWYDGRDSSKIWAQKVNLSGQLIGPNFPIQPDSTGSILGLEAQNHPDGRVLVSWVTNGQYSRGRWLDSQGNFMGEVFEMAEGFPDTNVLRSQVKFEAGGGGLIYQYTNIIEWFAGNEWVKYYYLTYIGNSGFQTAPRVQAGVWSSAYQEFSWWGNSNTTFPDLLFLPDSNMVTISRYTQSSGGGGYYYWHQYNKLYSSMLGDFAVPYGSVSNYQLCQIDGQSFLYSFDLEYIGLRKYEVASLDSSQQIAWISESDFASSQSKSAICAHQNGAFRVMYRNPVSSDFYIYTRHFDATGSPTGPDSLISRSGTGIPIFVNGARMELTADDESLIIWPYGSDILSTTFEQNIGSGSVVDFDVEPGSPLNVGIPNFDINASNHLMMLWMHVYDNGEWWEGRLFLEPYYQLFTPLHSSVLVKQWLGPDFFPLEEFDVALQNDGRFLVVWTKEASSGYQDLYKRSGMNYYTLLGTATIISGIQGPSSLEKSAMGYWLTWRLGNYIKLCLLDSDGNLVDSIRIISSDDAVSAGDPALAVSSSDNFAVCWQDARNDSGDIYCRQFNPDGSFFGNEYRVNSDPVGVMQKEPAVAFGPEDRLYFTWTDFRNPGGQGDIFCKVIEWEDALDAPVNQPPLPRTFALYPPSPNPFNAVTAIRYQLPAASYVSLRVYDTAGRLIKTLVDGRIEAGSHQVIFDGSDLASGIYIARLQAGDFVGTQKLVLLK